MAGRLIWLKNASIILAVICAVLLVYIPAAHAVSQPLVIVEVFKEDRVHLDIGDTTHVTRTLIIENKINKSVVPGMITLILQKQSPDKLGPISIPFTSSVRPMNVTNVKAKMGDGTEISDVRVTETENSTIIQYGAWVPIEPYQTLTVILEYDSPDIVERGLLFNTVQYPFTTSSIPVEKAVVEAAIDGGHVTYASEPPTINGNIYVWEKPQLGMGSWGVALEYSILPLPLLPISGGLLIWGLLLLICLLWVAWTYTRPRKKP
jgi:hypothetical protein